MFKFLKVHLGHFQFKMATVLNWPPKLKVNMFSLTKTLPNQNSGFIMVQEKSSFIMQDLG